MVWLQTLSFQERSNEVLKEVIIIDKVIPFSYTVNYDLIETLGFTLAHGRNLPHILR